MLKYDTLFGWTRYTDFFAKISIIDVFHAHHVGENDDTTGITESLPVISGFRIFVVVDDFAHLGTDSEAFPARSSVTLSLDRLTLDSLHL